MFLTGNAALDQLEIEREVSSKIEEAKRDAESKIMTEIGQLEYEVQRDIVGVNGDKNGHSLSTFIKAMKEERQEYIEAKGATEEKMERRSILEILTTIVLIAGVIERPFIVSKVVF